MTAYDDWYNSAVQILLDRYSSGEGGQGWADPGFSSPHGTPHPADFGSGSASEQTKNFVKNFVRDEGPNSNWIVENIGPPPRQESTAAMPEQTGTVPLPGYVSPDYAGSYDEWFETTVQILMDRYASGEGGEGWADPAFQSQYGTPNPNDFGNNTVSVQTETFIESFVRNEGESSTWIRENIGAPPDRDATYVPDPNSPSALQEGQRAEAQASRDFEAEQNRLAREAQAEIAAQNRAGRVDVANIQADASRYAADTSAAASRYAADQATARTMAQIGSAERIAAIDDATRRYIAEGDWGVQKWVTTENNRASMERLRLQLDFQDRELVQRAVEEKNRHHEQMVGLALEVAQYDAELAASPRNLMKYAAWLQNRNVVVNGMSLAMAAQEVPEDMIDPQEVAQTTGSNVAGIQTAQEQQALIDGSSGGNMQNLSPEELNSILSATEQQTGTQTLADQFPGQNMLPQAQASPSADQLDQSDPGALASQLLGSNPLQPTGEDFSTSNLQALMDSTRTAGGAQQAGFGAYNGPTTNALGVEIPEVTGQSTDFRKFAKMLPTEQGIKLSGIESVRGPSGVTDYTEELLRSRPKGRASGGGVSFG